MRTLILHAGLMKCGTTSVQYSLYRARKLLAERNIGYWGITPTHNEPLWILSQNLFNNLSPGRKIQFGSPEKVERNLADFLAVPHQFSILSSERMGRLNGPGRNIPGPGDARGKFRRAVIAAGFDRIRIIAYIRPPIAWWSSVIQERAKTVTWDEALKTETSYRTMLEPLEQLFPEAETILRPFEPAEFVDGSLLVDFFDAAGIPVERLDGIEEVRANPSLSLEGTRYLDHLWRQAEKDDFLGMSFIDDYLRPNFETGHKFQLPREALAELVEKNRDDLAWISARMQRDMTPAIPEDDADLSPEVMNTLSARLILHLLRENRRLISERALNNARRFTEKGDHREARNRALNALHAWPQNTEARALLDSLNRTD